MKRPPKQSGLENVMRVRRLIELDIFSSEKRMLTGDLVAAYNYHTAGQDWKIEPASSQRCTMTAQDQQTQITTQ